MEPFIHLHVHTQYSLLDGQAAIDRILAKASKDGMHSIAITDHGNMFGIKEFSNKVKKLNAKRADNDKFKPIIGCECYCARNGRHIKKGKENLSGWHLILLAKNKNGYKNLIKMVSLSWIEGFYGKPRIDKELLQKYHEDIICCSACIAGEIPNKVLKGQYKEAKEAALWFKNLFGNDYYLEMQRHKTNRPDAAQDTYLKQQEANEGLIKIAKELHIKLIATNDVHFVEEEDADAHDRLICLSTGKDLDDPKRMRYSKQEWMKTTEEMNKVFEDFPEALRNTTEIADKVEFYSIDNGPIMPTFQIPKEFGTEELYHSKFTESQLYDEFTADENGKPVSKEEGLAKIKRLGGYDKIYRLKLEADYLKELTYEGAKACYPQPFSKELIDRLEFELYIMKSMGFPGYFLIVQDFIKAAREELSVAVGPGRGSAAGSAVAFCLGITRIDPIKYDLLFERFLNPDRISLPDIDTDFDDDGRGEVLRWVTEKYGANRVAHIITYGTMATKSSIKDVARVQNLPLSESNRLAKLVPDKIPGVKKIHLKDAIQYVPELRNAASSSDPKLRNTLKYAQMLEGNVRNTGVHACGVIIGRYDISDVVPVSTAKDKETGEEMLVTQYEGSVIEETGLIKMDFLGLKTLSIIKEAIENIRIARHEEIDIDHIDIQDPKTYELYCTGRTTGTFQFESTGMQKYLKELQPSKFEDLIAMNALYRPGPMDYIPSFIARKHGKEKIEYDIPIMERYLKDTYGITVYQEQVMLLSRLLANFTRGESDTLRKAMGKKLIEKMNVLKAKFISGGLANGHKENVLNKIWADWEKFASYAFNKSHATCYSWVAYQTAFLKANYPSEYMAAVLSRNLSDITTITKFMDECKAMGIQVLGPDINESLKKFSVNSNGDIRFGLAGVKGVGDAAVRNIITEREKNGPYKDIFDVVERVNLTACNKKNLEALALSGAFDNFDIYREQFFNQTKQDEPYIEQLVRYGNKFQLDKQESSNSLFGGENMVAIAKPQPEECQRWGNLKRLDKEKELVGIYLSAHPLDPFKVVLNDLCNTKVIELENKENLVGREIMMGGIITNFREGMTKRGAPYGILKIEDYSGTAEIPLFGDNYIQFNSYGKVGLILIIQAQIEPHRWKPGEMDLKLISMKLMTDNPENLIHSLRLKIPIKEMNQSLINNIKGIAKENPGKSLLYIDVEDWEENISLSFLAQGYKINVTPKVVDACRTEHNLVVKINS